MGSSVRSLIENFMCYDRYAHRLLAVNTTEDRDHMTLCYHLEMMLTISRGSCVYVKQSKALAVFFSVAGYYSLSVLYT